MSWTYSGDPKDSALDECRFIIGDTDINEPIMQDEEIQYLIDTYSSSINVLYYNLFMRTATLFARDVKRRLGPQSEDPTERLKFFNEQALYYKGKITAAGLSIPEYAYPKIFRKGMNSNPPYDTTLIEGYLI
jgi:hypothetical protein